MTRTALFAHASADLYGSDRTFLESVSGLGDAGWRVVVVLPGDGPLVGELRRRGAEVHLVDLPVLRKALLSPWGLARLGAASVRAWPPLRRLVRTVDPAVVYVNTLTIPLVLAAGRWAGRPTLCHVHEAEKDIAKTLRRLLALPTLLADVLVVNSEASAALLTDSLPRLRQRIRLIYNGVPGPPVPAAPLSRGPGPSTRLVCAGRLSPRKGTDLAVEALAVLAQRGCDVVLDLVGSVFPGYEWFEEQLRRRVTSLGLADRVRFRGFQDPVWPALAMADIVLVPSRVEPFGNIAVEAQLCRRPVVAARVQGLAEIVEEGRTGLLVPAGDAVALADAVQRLLSDPDLARDLAETGHREAGARFGVDRYRREIAEVAALLEARGRVLRWQARRGGPRRTVGAGLGTKVE